MHENGDLPHEGFPSPNGDQRGAKNVQSRVAGMLRDAHRDSSRDTQK